MTSANPHRGEGSLQVGGDQGGEARPKHQGLAAEQELGPLFVLVERASEGKLSLLEIASLFDHLSAGRPDGISRERIGEAIVEQGLAGVAPTLRLVLGQILKGR